MCCLRARPLLLMRGVPVVLSSSTFAAVHWCAAIGWASLHDVLRGPPWLYAAPVSAAPIKHRSVLLCCVSVRASPKPYRSMPGHTLPLLLSPLFFPPFRWARRHLECISWRTFWVLAGPLSLSEAAGSQLSLMPVQSK